MAEAKTTMKGELTISPDAFNRLVKLKEELEDVIETIEIMNEKQKRLHQTFLQAKTFTKKMLTLLFCKQKHQDAVPSIDSPMYAFQSTPTI